MVEPRPLALEADLEEEQAVRSTLFGMKVKEQARVATDMESDRSDVLMACQQCIDTTKLSLGAWRWSLVVWMYTN